MADDARPGVPTTFGPVRVDQDGYLVAPVVEVERPVGAIEAVLSFLDTVNPDDLEGLVLSEYEDLPTSEAHVEALKAMVRRAGD